MTYPKYLSYFYRKNQILFTVLSDMNERVAENTLREDVLGRGGGTYLKYRKKHEHYLRNKFIEKGGLPKRTYPIYMILGDSPTGSHDLNKEYELKMTIPLSLFSSEDLSFTYPDSLYKVPLNSLDQIFLERDEAPNIYTLQEIPDLIDAYKVYDYDNHYIEAQIWNKEPLNKWMKL